MSEFDPKKLKIKVETSSSGYSGTEIVVSLYYDGEYISSDSSTIQEGQAPAY